jgi:hypothetical protein
MKQVITALIAILFLTGTAYAYTTSPSTGTYNVADSTTFTIYANPGSLLDALSVQLELQIAGGTITSFSVDSNFVVAGTGSCNSLYAICKAIALFADPGVYITQGMPLGTVTVRWATPGTYIFTRVNGGYYDSTGGSYTFGSNNVAGGDYIVNNFGETATPTLTPTGSIVPTDTVSPTSTVPVTGTVLPTGTIINPTRTVSPTGGPISPTPTRILPRTALVSDHNDMVIAGLLLIITGFAIYYLGISKQIGDLFWNLGGRSILPKVSKKYENERVNEIRNKFEGTLHKSKAKE